MVKKRSKETLDKQKRMTEERLKEKERKANKQKKKTKDRVEAKDGTIKDIPKKQPTKEKPTINLNEPADKDLKKLGREKITQEEIEAKTPEGGIYIGGATTRRTEERKRLESFTKAAVIGAGVTGAIAGGMALAAPTATAAAINSGFAQQAAATAKYTHTATRSAIAATPKLGQMTINAKTIGLTKSFLSKKFGWKAMAFAGTWMSSVFLGQWGQAEAPESIMIPIRELISTAETPEDWAEVDEHLRIAAEISDTSTWEEIALWSPFSAIKGIASKTKGVAEGVKILAETAEKAKELQQEEEAQGESDFAKERRESDEAARERDIKYQEEDTEKYDKIKEENDAEKLKDAEIMQEVWRLRREGGAVNLAKADELEKTAYTN